MLRFSFKKSFFSSKGEIISETKLAFYREIKTAIVAGCLTSDDSGTALSLNIRLTETENLRAEEVFESQFDSFKLIR